MKKNKKRFYQLLFSLTILFVVGSLISLWSSSSPSQWGMMSPISPGDMMNSGPTMGISMTKYMFSGMSLSDVFTPMAQMMGMMKGMMASNLLYDALNVVLTILLIMSTAVLIGASIILIMLWM